MDLGLDSPVDCFYDFSDCLDLSSEKNSDSDYSEDSLNQFHFKSS